MFFVLFALCLYFKWINRWISINCDLNLSIYDYECLTIAVLNSIVRSILALILGLAVCTIRRKDTQKKMLQMFPDDDIRETIINYADGAGEENTVFILSFFSLLFDSLFFHFFLIIYNPLLLFMLLFYALSFGFMNCFN